jgi:hypothetical protein
MATQEQNSACSNDVSCHPAWPRQGIALSALATTVLLGACGATVGGLSTSSIAAYQPASLFSPNGYSVSNNSDGSLRVTAGGPPGTPVDRLEKIALARAAEYGDELHAKTFKATPAQASIKCGKTNTYIKGERVQLHPLDYRIVEIDVAYGADAGDPQVRKTHETAQTLKAELAAETVPPDVQAAAAQEVAQHCGR